MNIFDTASNFKPGKREQRRNDIPYFSLLMLFKDASLKDTNTHQHTELMDGACTKPHHLVLRKNLTKKDYCSYTDSTI